MLKTKHCESLLLLLRYYLVKYCSFQNVSFICVVDFASVGTTDSSKSHVSTLDYLEKRQKVRRKSGNIIAGIPGIGLCT